MPVLVGQPLAQAARVDARALVRDLTSGSPAPTGPEVVLEARDRVGGRVWSTTMPNGAVIEMGAARRGDIAYLAVIAAPMTSHAFAPSIWLLTL